MSQPLLCPIVLSLVRRCSKRDDGIGHGREGVQERGVGLERVDGRRAARVEGIAVLVVLDDAGFDGDAEDVARSERGVRLVDAVLPDLGVPRLEADGEVDSRLARAGGPATQAGVTDQYRLGGRELPVAVAR